MTYVLASLRHGFRPLHRLAFLILFIEVALTAQGAPAPALASAAPAPSGSTVTFASLGQNTQTLSGANPSLDLYVPGPGQGVLGSDTSILLLYTTSPLVDSQASSLSVLVNGVSVTGHLLTGSPDRQATLSLHLPASSLNQAATNHIQLAFSLQDRTHRPCDLSNPDLAVTVYGKSWLRYNIRRTLPGVFGGGMAQLPAPFVAPGLQAPPPLAVGLPATPTQTELTGAANILARLGEDDPGNPPRVTTVTSGSLDRSALQGNLLLVGTPRDNPALAAVRAGTSVVLSHRRWIDGQGHPLTAGEGLVMEAPNPWNPRNAVLLATGNDQEGVRRAATVLASATLRRLLHGRYALLPGAPHVPLSMGISQGTVSLSSLGYQTTTVEGNGERDARFTFDLPHAPAQGGTFHVVYGHSDTVNTGLSSIRVDLNGQPLSSRQFSANDSAHQSWDVTLPQDTLTAGSNVLTVRFFLDTSYTYCKAPVAGSLWGTVDASSNLTLPGNAAGSASALNLLPFPLLINGSPNDTVLVVPSRVVQQHDALTLALLIGTRSHVDTPQLLVVGARTVSTGALKNHAVVLDGLPRTNPLIAQVEPYEPVRAPSSLDFSADTSGLTASIQEAGQVGIVEEFASPWSAGYTVLLFSATKPSLLPAIRRTAFGAGLNGTVATVDAHGKFQSFNTSLTVPNAPAGAKKRPIMALTIAGLAALLLLAAVTVTQRNHLEKGAS